ncbi:MAG: FlgD immunoglobulin-like domain containing protein [Candidatus Cloacimonadia bacterium]
MWQSLAEVYNIKGRLVKTIVDAHKEKGYYTAIWDGKDNNGKPVSSGIYFYKLETDNSQSQIRKMLLIR